MECCGLEILVDTSFVDKSAKDGNGEKPPLNDENKVLIYPNPADKHVILELGEERYLQLVEILNV